MFLFMPFAFATGLMWRFITKLQVLTIDIAPAERHEGTMPFRSYESYEFSKSGIARYAPVGPGIYGIHNGRSLWIYIDQAQNIEMQLASHLRGESVYGARIMQNLPAYFTFEKHNDDRVLPSRRQELIREYHPIYCLI